MWAAHTKDELAIEVWEKLDCESVGEAEIESIQTAIAGRFGESAVDSPMKIARLLADEGAVLRHPEILRTYVRQQLPSTPERELRDQIDISGLPRALASIRLLETERQNRRLTGDTAGQKQLREIALEAKRRVNEKIASQTVDPDKRAVNIEITEWLSHWIQTPALFESWVAMRIESRDFIARFGRINDA
ncbi:MAG TPA: hypothetical protein PKA82_09820 [Pyrinomonadaceae bacterium]|nr:hypothetical protein [Pyrinomonadaceae bacterium]